MQVHSRSRRYGSASRDTVSAAPPTGEWLGRQFVTVMSAVAVPLRPSDMQVTSIGHVPAFVLLPTIHFHVATPLASADVSDRPLASDTTLE